MTATGTSAINRDASYRNAFLNCHLPDTKRQECFPSTGWMQIMPCFIPRNFVFHPSSLLLRRKNHETQPNIFCSNRYSVAVSYFFCTLSRGTCLFLHSGNHVMNCRPPILLSNKPTFITRHAKKPQELSQQFKSSLLLITIRFLIQMPTFHLPARFLMKLTVSHTILLRMLFHSRKRYLIHRSYL